MEKAKEPITDSDAEQSKDGDSSEIECSDVNSKKNGISNSSKGIRKQKKKR